MRSLFQLKNWPTAKSKLWPRLKPKNLLLMMMSKLKAYLRKLFLMKVKFVKGWSTTAFFRFAKIRFFFHLFIPPSVFFCYDGFPRFLLARKSGVQAENRLPELKKRAIPARNSIFSLQMSICKLKMSICSLKMCICRLKMENNPYLIRYFPVLSASIS